MHETLGRTALLDSFQTLQHGFGDSLASARQLEQTFEESRKTFHKNIADHLHAAHQRLPKGHPAYEQITTFISALAVTQAEWDKAVAGREKGVKFQQDFGDSLLVFVNGKVKSGKSSLGNYMAWGDTDPTPGIKQGLPAHLAPQYFSAEQTDVHGGDAINEAEQQREFRVGAVEATSSIQGFRLPGLTWVDSPGLHSMNKRNGELAQRYVEHADLILYTMKSDSPGRDSDLKEISRLYRKDKKLVLLLTGSDDIDENVGPDGFTIVQNLVMKGAARCAKQAAYVRAALAEHCGDDVAASADILSISARYAQLHEAEPDAFHTSGMGVLFSTLHRIAQSEGILLKQRTPVDNLHHFLQDCHAGLAPYDKLIASFRQPLQDIKKQSDQRLAALVHTGQGELQRFIDTFFDDIEAEHSGSQRESSALQGKLAGFPGALNEKARQIVKQQLASIFAELMAGFASVVDASFQASTLVDLPDFAQSKVQEKVQLLHAGTRTRNTGLGSLVGGAIGFFVGGPVGAGIGASLGGALGGATGSSASTDFREIDVTVGDNLLQIRLQATRDGRQALDQQIRAGVTALWGAVEQDVDQLLIGLRHEIQQFDSNLQLLLQATSEETMTP